MPKVKDRKWYHQVPREAKDRKWYHRVPCEAKSCFQQRESSSGLAEVDSQARFIQAESVFLSVTKVVWYLLQKNIFL